MSGLALLCVGNLFPFEVALDEAMKYLTSLITSLAAGETAVQLSKPILKIVQGRDCFGGWLGISREIFRGLLSHDKMIDSATLLC